MATFPIYQVGTRPCTKQAAQDANGQWFYRVHETHPRTGWGRWIPCFERPQGAWFNPAIKQRAELPTAFPDSTPPRQYKDD